MSAAEIKSVFVKIQRGESITLDEGELFLKGAGPRGASILCDYLQKNPISEINNQILLLLLGKIPPSQLVDLTSTLLNKVTRLELTLSLLKLLARLPGILTFPVFLRNLHENPLKGIKLEILKVLKTIPGDEIKKGAYKIFREEKGLVPPLVDWMKLTYRKELTPILTQILEENEFVPELLEVAKISKDSEFLPTLNFLEISRPELVFEIYLIRDALSSVSPVSVVSSDSSVSLDSLVPLVSLPPEVISPDPIPHQIGVIEVKPQPMKIDVVQKPEVPTPIVKESPSLKNPPLEVKVPETAPQEPKQKPVVVQTTQPKSEEKAEKVDKIEIPEEPQKEGSGKDLFSGLAKKFASFTNETTAKAPEVSLKKKGLLEKQKKIFDEVIFPQYKKVGIDIYKRFELDAGASDFSSEIIAISNAKRRVKEQTERVEKERSKGGGGFFSKLLGTNKELANAEVVLTRQKEEFDRGFLLLGQKAAQIYDKPKFDAMQLTRSWNAIQKGLLELQDIEETLQTVK